MTEPAKAATVTAEEPSGVVNKSDAVPGRTDAEKKLEASREANVKRMQPGHVETDATTGIRVIHPAGNPQQVNPIHDDEHEAAAVEEAKVLTDKNASPREKIEATEKSNQAEGAPSAIATAAHEKAVEDDQEKREKIEQREKERKESAQKAHAKHV